MSMERDEGASEKFSNGLAGSEACDHVAVAVFEDEDSGKWGAVGRCEHGFAMPRRAVHSHGSVGTQVRVAVPQLAWPYDDSVVAEDFDFFTGNPEARGGAL